MISKGEKAPLSFTLKNDKNEDINLEKYTGKYLVLYFYPKDNTPGCTKEACDFRDYNKEIEELGAKVIGVSSDSAKSHENFKERHKLNFELIADDDKKLHEAFGAWGEKSMFGKKYMGTIRSTFIINPQGVVEKVWDKVSVPNHAKEVYEYLKENKG